MITRLKNVGRPCWRKFKTLKRAIHNTVYESQATWACHLADEVAFWDSYLETRGLQWPEVFQLRLDPNLELQPPLRALLEPYPPGSVISILDVGAGPFTAVGKRWAERKISITAVDPLANEYDRLLKKYDIQPLVKTDFCKAEDLTGRFQVDQFDLVYARNSIDHAIDPLRAIGEMLAVVKKGSYVYLHHHQKEGETEGYQGLHQWNFYVNEGMFWISSPGKGAKNVTKLRSNSADIRASVDADNMLTVTMRKTV
jgi:SAM-dependent methyltransferase